MDHLAFLYSVVSVSPVLLCHSWRPCLVVANYDGWTYWSRPNIQTAFRLHLAYDNTLFCRRQFVRRVSSSAAKLHEEQATEMHTDTAVTTGHS